MPPRRKKNTRGQVDPGFELDSETEKWTKERPLRSSTKARPAVETDVSAYPKDTTGSPNTRDAQLLTAIKPKRPGLRSNAASDLKTSSKEKHVRFSNIDADASHGTEPAVDSGPDDQSLGNTSGVQIPDRLAYRPSSFNVEVRERQTLWVKNRATDVKEPDVILEVKEGGRTKQTLWFSFALQLDAYRKMDAAYNDPSTPVSKPGIEDLRQCIPVKKALPTTLRAAHCRTIAWLEAVTVFYKLMQDTARCDDLRDVWSNYMLQERVSGSMRDAWLLLPVLDVHGKNAESSGKAGTEALGSQILFDPAPSSHPSRKDPPSLSAMNLEKTADDAGSTNEALPNAASGGEADSGPSSAGQDVAIASAAERTVGNGTKNVQETPAPRRMTTEAADQDHVESEGRNPRPEPDEPMVNLGAAPTAALTVDNVANSASGLDHDRASDDASAPSSNGTILKQSQSVVQIIPSSRIIDLTGDEDDGKDHGQATAFHPDTRRTTAKRSLNSDPQVQPHAKRLRHSSYPSQINSQLLTYSFPAAQQPSQGALVPNVPVRASSNTRTSVQPNASRSTTRNTLRGASSTPGVHRDLHLEQALRERQQMANEAIAPASPRNTYYSAEHQFARPINPYTRGAPAVISPYASGVAPARPAYTWEEVKNAHKNFPESVIYDHWRALQMGYIPVIRASVLPQIRQAPPARTNSHAVPQNSSTVSQPTSTNVQSPASSIPQRRPAPPARPNDAYGHNRSVPQIMSTMYQPTSASGQSRASSGPRRRRALPPRSNDVYGHNPSVPQILSTIGQPDAPPRTTPRGRSSLDA